MDHQLTMQEKPHVLALLEHGRSDRRVEAETGDRRESISRYDAARQEHAAAQPRIALTVRTVRRLRSCWPRPGTSGESCRRGGSCTEVGVDRITRW